MSAIFVYNYKYKKMKIPLSLKAVALLLVISIFFASCASTTIIQSEPTGAKLYLNGESVG